jgi:predicted ABC-type ATPase
MAQPVFYLLAGPNGAGKSTLYRAAVAAGLIAESAEFVNADVYERDHLARMRDPALRSEAARQWADARRAHLIAQGDSFVSETVFSHASKLELIANAQSQGYCVVLLVVCLDKPERLLQRVRQRVSEGGHDVPAQRILARYPRTLTHLKQAVRLADMALLYDSGQRASQGVNLPVQVAMCRGSATTQISKTLPQWARKVLGLQPLSV